MVRRLEPGGRRGRGTTHFPVHLVSNYRGQDRGSAPPCDGRRCRSFVRRGRKIHNSVEPTTSRTASLRRQTRRRPLMFCTVFLSLRWFQKNSKRTRSLREVSVNSQSN